MTTSPGAGHREQASFCPAGLRAMVVDTCTPRPTPTPQLPGGLPVVAAAAKSLHSCPTLCDPIDGSPQAPPSLGFSRQEHWSGLPFPSPLHEREK